MILPEVSLVLNVSVVIPRALLLVNVVAPLTTSLSASVATPLSKFLKLSRNTTTEVAPTVGLAFAKDKPAAISNVEPPSPSVNAIPFFKVKGCALAKAVCTDCAGELYATLYILPLIRSTTFWTVAACILVRSGVVTSPSVGVAASISLSNSPRAVSNAFTFSSVIKANIPVYKLFVPFVNANSIEASALVSTFAYFVILVTPVIASELASHVNNVEEPVIPNIA